MGKWTALAIEANRPRNGETSNRQNRQNSPEPAKEAASDILSVMSVRGLAVSESSDSELSRAVNRVADHHGFTDEQRQEALDMARADPIAALECFRTLVASIPPDHTLPDDMRRCMNCRNLREGYCQIERFSPALDVLRRCETFKPRTIH